MAILTLTPTLGGMPEEIEAKEAEPEQLYDALDAWHLFKIKYGRGKSEAAFHARAVANVQSGLIKRELRRRGLSVMWRPDAQPG